MKIIRSNPHHTNDPEFHNDELAGESRVFVFIACLSMFGMVLLAFIVDLFTGECFRRQRRPARTGKGGSSARPRERAGVPPSQTPSRRAAPADLAS